MPLYSTVLLLGSNIISYEVYKEGDRLFFKPAEPDKKINAPIFWVIKEDGVWKPVNMQDPDFIRRLQDDISRNYPEPEA